MAKIKCPSCNKEVDDYEDFRQKQTNDVLKIEL